MTQHKGQEKFCPGRYAPWAKERRPLRHGKTTLRECAKEAARYPVETWLLDHRIVERVQPVKASLQIP